MKKIVKIDPATQKVVPLELTTSQVLACEDIGYNAGIAGSPTPISWLYQAMLNAAPDVDEPVQEPFIYAHEMFDTDNNRTELWLGYKQKDPEVESIPLWTQPSLFDVRELVGAVQFIIRGFETGSIKGQPFLDFENPNAENLELKHPHTYLKETLEKFKKSYK